MRDEDLLIDSARQAKSTRIEQPTRQTQTSVLSERVDTLIKRLDGLDSKLRQITVRIIGEQERSPAGFDHDVQPTSMHWTVELGSKLDLMSALLLGMETSAEYLETFI